MFIRKEKGFRRFLKLTKQGANEQLMTAYRDVLKELEMHRRQESIYMERIADYMNRVLDLQKQVDEKEKVIDCLQTRLRVDKSNMHVA